MVFNFIHSLLYLPMAIFLVSGVTVIQMVHGVETPEHTVVYSASDFEIRLYSESSWMSAFVQGTSFENSTRDGFHRLYQYIHGANLNFTHMEMTAPVLTSIAPSTEGFDYYVRSYVSSQYQTNPPLPDSELNLLLDKWGSRCIAVRKFSGFAKDDDIDREYGALKNSLSQNGTSVAIKEYKTSYVVAQYDAPFRLSARLNEIWIDLSGNTSAAACTRN